MKESSYTRVIFYLLERSRYGGNLRSFLFLLLPRLPHVCVIYQHSRVYIHEESGTITYFTFPRKEILKWKECRDKNVALKQLLFKSLLFGNMYLIVGLKVRFFMKPNTNHIK
jgi:hypothetical protein